MKCTTCKRREATQGYKQCNECRERKRQEMAALRAREPERMTAYKRDWDRKQRINVLAHYGGRCACCGETEFEFLSIDHTDGGGTKHRRELKMRGASIIRWLIKNGYPEGFRVLCHNCNQAIGFYGKCPHERADLVVLLGGDE